MYIEARDEGSQDVVTTELGEMKMSGEGERRRKQYRGCPITNRQPGRPRPIFQRRGTLAMVRFNRRTRLRPLVATRGGSAADLDGAARADEGRRTRPQHVYRHTGGSRGRSQPVDTCRYV